MDLAVADVDGQHATGTSLEQAVGETTGRTPGVDRCPLGDIDVELIKCRLKLVAASADKPRSAPQDLDRIRGSHLAARLVSNRTANQYSTSLDRLTGLSPRFDEPSSDEHLIEPLSGHGLSPWRD